VAGVAALLLPGAAAAHAVSGIDYRFPLPVWLYALAAGLAVLLSAPAATLAGRATGTRTSGDLYGPLRRFHLGWIAVALASLLLVDVVAGGLFGPEDFFENPATIVLWVDFWVGLGIVSALKHLTTKKGEPMVFMRLDDVSGSVETIVFNSVYGAARDLLEADRILVVKGRIDHKEGETKLIAMEVAPFEATPERSEVRLKLDARKAPAGTIQELAALLREYPGEAPVVAAPLSRPIQRASASGRRRSSCSCGPGWSSCGIPARSRARSC